MYSVTRHINCR